MRFRVADELPTAITFAGFATVVAATAAGLLAAAAVAVATAAATAEASSPGSRSLLSATMAATSRAAPVGEFHCVCSAIIALTASFLGWV